MDDGLTEFQFKKYIYTTDIKQCSSVSVLDGRGPGFL